MNLQLKGLDKRGRNAVYTGAAVSLRFPISAFPDKKPPTTLEVSGVAKPMTAEERKAARAAQPKLTPQQKLTKMEERLSRLRAQLAT